jgi:hypothetical protein
MAAIFESRTKKTNHLDLFVHNLKEYACGNDWIPDIGLQECVHVHISSNTIKYSVGEAEVWCLYLWT